MSSLNTLMKGSPSSILGKRFVSKWIVFIIDLMLISLALLISFSLRSNIDLYQMSFISYYKGLISVLLFSSIGHLLFKPHEGIIRHAGVHDIKMIFYSISFSLALNGIFIFFIAKSTIFKHYALPFEIASINYFLSLFILIQFRYGIKFIFNQGKKAKSKPAILIYGAGEAGQITCEALSPYYDIIAFIDDNSSLAGKSYKGIKILLPNSRLHRLIEKNNIHHLVIAIQNISKSEMRAIVNKCIELKVEIKEVPPIEKWINGELTQSQIKNVKIEELLGRNVISHDKSLLAAEIAGKNILVTGAAGSIGSELIRQLLPFKPNTLILLDQAETPLYNLEIDLLKERLNNEVDLRFVLGDIKDESMMRCLFRDTKLDWVFHAAAYKHVPSVELNPIHAIQVNILGTRLIANLADEFGVSKMVFISTDKAVNPTNVMGASKRAAEMYVQSKDRHSNTEYITTRFGNVLGSNGSVIPHFKKQIKSGGPITVTHPEVTRYFMTIPEACLLVLDAGVIGNGGEIFVFDMGESIKIVDLAEKMIRLSGLIPYKDIQIEFVGLRPGEKLFEELLNDEEHIIPTDHDKIMSAKVKEYNLNHVIQYIDRIQDKIMKEGDTESVIAELKKMVPEFISQNSPYEKLDQLHALEKTLEIA